MKFLESVRKGPNQVWRYLIVILGGFMGGQMLGVIPFVMVMGVKTTANGGAGALNSSHAMDMTSLGISHNLGLFLMLLPFVVSLFLMIYLIRWLHGRTFAETVNGTRKIRWKRVASGAIVWGILMLASFGLSYWIEPENYIFQLDWEKFAILTVIALALIPLQTTCEEVLFRGYLTQGVAGWSRSRWAAILIPGLLFGLMHCFNPEVKEFGFWQTMPSYVLLGVLFGLIVVMDDGIELVIGIHAVNNVFTCLTTTHPASALQTDALFMVRSVDPMDGLYELIVISIVIVAYFATKYKWNFNILRQKV
jgi:membrane protease YdiL (CAAX protease family)